MKWRKLGKIFDPRDLDLPDDCSEWAQSPQALVFDDFIRIYFSTRQRDSRKGKYLSHISFVDMKRDFSIIGVTKHSVIELGKPGCFDEHGIFPMNVKRRNDEIYAYTCGWSRRVSVPVETSIGLAISTDNGLTFRKIGDGPILTSSLHEPFLVGDPFVQVYEGKFHMWYIFGTVWRKFSQSESPDRVYKIGHAISEDGVTWEKEEGRQIISDGLNSDECQALPTVIKVGDRYHMWFCYRQSSDFRKNRSRSYRIGYAFSHDLVNWTRDDGNAGIDVSQDGWDSEMLCYPHVFECAGKLYLLYNGNEFGRYGFGVAVLE